VRERHPQRAERGKPAKTSTVATLSDYGISRDQSSRWQKLAAVPAADAVEDDPIPWQRS
jgi:hypothetical protein